ncbi:hypothetical protein CEXT_798551 [Caerostris extrusa]|uniref:Uncharacterized protein n=1 Tax=Caerostris extrusa TaxID=172846 RepID=A0AAV4Q2V8_CAEEX|nr:hypothetical protein CEXT_798551 [Caerostris extrusa]
MAGDDFCCSAASEAAIRDMVIAGVFQFYRLFSPEVFRVMERAVKTALFDFDKSLGPFKRSRRYPLVNPTKTQGFRKHMAEDIFYTTIIINLDLRGGSNECGICGTPSAEYLITRGPRKAAVFSRRNLPSRVPELFVREECVFSVCGIACLSHPEICETPLLVDLMHGNDFRFLSPHAYA